MMFGFGILGILLMFVPALIIGGIVWLVVVLARSGQGTGSLPGAKPEPLEILKVRYAKGEITKDQFEQMKRDLV